MGLRRIIVLLIALVAAGGTAMYARSWVASQQVVQTVAAPAPKEEIHEVLVADSDLPAGTFVKPQHLRWQRWPHRRRARELCAQGRALRRGHDRRRRAQAHRGRRADHRRRRGQAG